MKSISLLLLFTASFLLLPAPKTEAQIFKKIKKRTKKKVSNMVVNKVSDKAASIAADKMDKVLNAKINLFPKGGKKEDISDLPKKYSFNWKYTMEVINNANKKQNMEFVYYLTKENGYFGYSFPQQPNVFVIMDPQHDAMVSLIINDGNHVGMVYSLPNSFDETADTGGSGESAASFDESSFTKLPSKRFLGFKADGIKYETDEYEMTYYYSTAPGVTLTGGLSSKKVKLPSDAKELAKTQDALPLYMEMTNKKSGDVTILKGKKLEKVYTDKKLDDYRIISQ